MASLNRCQFIGRLGRDPEVRAVGEGSVTNFSVAVSERFKGRDGTQQERTEWVNCVAWQKLGEVCAQYLKKGSLVYVEGSLQNRSWEKDGEKRTATDIRLTSMQMLGARDGGNVREPQDYPSGPANADTLPF